MKKIMLYIVSFAMIGTFGTILILSLADKFFYQIRNSSVIDEENNYLKELAGNNKQAIEMEDGATLIQYSHNNKYYTYLKEGKIYIMDYDKKELVDTIVESKTICYYNLLYDKNLIMYFTEETLGSSSKLVLKTYEITSKAKKEYNTFNVQHFNRIKEMEFSPVINIIYMNIETKQGVTYGNTLYRIDLWNSMSKVSSNKIITKLTMLKHKDRLYYEDDKGNIYYAGGKLTLFKNEVDLIGTDKDDILYFIDRTTKDKVYKVENNKIMDTIQLSDTDVVTWYSDNTAVYLVYPTYLLNIASDEPYKRLVRLSDYVEFVTIKSDHVYLKTKDNIVIRTKLLDK